MIRQAAGSTDQRKEKIMRLLKQVNHNGSKTIQSFGLKVDNEFIDVPARLLNPPMIEYKNRKTVEPKRGAWAMAGNQFLESVSGRTKWCIIIADKYMYEEPVMDFAKKVAILSPSCGLQLENQPVEIIKVDMNKLRMKLQQIGANKQIGIVFCVIPNSGPTYAEIKQIAELECGVLTQCVKTITIQKKGTDPSTVSNILLKVNTKLNGTNHKLEKSAILNEFDVGKVMFIGADVTHPTPGQTEVPRYFINLNNFKAVEAQRNIVFFFVSISFQFRRCGSLA